MTGLLDPFFTRLESSPSLRWQGHVTQVIGQMVESAGPYCSVGDACSVIDAHGNELEGEVVGFRDNMVLSMPLERPAGIRFGDRVVTQGMRPRLRVGRIF
jgi:flagellum-specific ATP synthase